MIKLKNFRLKLSLKEIISTGNFTIVKFLILLFQGLINSFCHHFSPFFIRMDLIRKQLGKKLHRGFFFGLCLTYIFTFRFFIEFLKENQEDFENSMMFNMGQWLSVPFIIIGVYFMFFYDKKKNKIA